MRLLVSVMILVAGMNAWGQQEAVPRRDPEVPPSALAAPALLQRMRESYRALEQLDVEVIVMVNPVGPTLEESGTLLLSSQRVQVDMRSGAVQLKGAEAVGLGIETTKDAVRFSFASAPDSVLVLPRPERVSYRWIHSVLTKLRGDGLALVPFLHPELALVLDGDLSDLVPVDLLEVPREGDQMAAAIAAFDQHPALAGRPPNAPALAVLTGRATNVSAVIGIDPETHRLRIAIVRAPGHRFGLPNREVEVGTVIVERAASTPPADVPDGASLKEITDIDEMAKRLRTVALTQVRDNLDQFRELVAEVKAALEALPPDDPRRPDGEHTVQQLERSIDAALKEETLPTK